MKCNHIFKKQGTETIWEFLFSEPFHNLSNFFIPIPILLASAIFTSKTTTALFQNSTNLMPVYIMMILFFMACIMVVICMKKLYKYAAQSLHTYQGTFRYFSFLQCFSLILTIFFIFFTLVFFFIATDNDALYNSTEMQKDFFFPWNLKFLLFLSLLAICSLQGIGMTRWIFSVEKTLKTDKIHINGTGFLNTMTIANSVAFAILFIITLIDQDWILAVFFAYMVIFNIAILFATMRYFKICNKALATQYDDYIAQIHEEYEIEYYDEFADKEDTFAAEKTFSRDKPYKFDTDFKDFEFYTPKKIDNDTDPDAVVIGTCPSCQGILHDDRVCPFCGYVIYKTVVNPKK